MDEKEIKKFIEETIKGTFAQVELSNKLKELDDLKQSNKELVAKLASVEGAEIPSEKVDEITEVVEKAIGDKVDTAVGEALAEIVGRVDEMETSMTDMQRLKDALSNKTPFKPMSRPSKAYTEGSDVDVQKELDAITKKLKDAKDEKSLQEVKDLLQAFITSSASKIKCSADDSSELDAYRELGTVDEIEAAVEVLETYADEVGTLPELDADDGSGLDVDDDSELDIEMLSKRKKAMLSAKRRKAALSAKKKAMIAKRKKVLASKRKVSVSSRVERIKRLKEKARQLATSGKTEVKRPVIETSSQDIPGSLAMSLFTRK